MDAAQSATEARPTFSRRLNRVLRGLVFAAALLAAVAAAAYYYARSRADEEIRGFVEARLREHYAQRGLDVSLGYARLAEGHGVELRDLVILDPSAEAPYAELAHIDQIFIFARIELQDLLSEPPPAEHVAVHRLKLHAARQIDGTWNTARLMPLPECGGKSPTVSIDDAVVQIDDARSGHATSLGLREINLTITPLDRGPTKGPRPKGTLLQGGPTEGARLPTATPKGAPISTSGAPSKSALKIDGTLTGDHFHKLHLSGIVDAQRGTWSMGGTVEELKLSPELYGKLPRELDQHVAPLAGLKGQATLQFDAARTAPGAPLAFKVQGRLQQAHLIDARLPFPLTEISAQVYADNRRLEVNNLQARCGAGTLQLSLRQDGLRVGSPLSLRLDAKHLLLEEGLEGMLPEELRASWRSFDPAGPVDLALTLTFDGRTWTPEVVADCRGASFAYEVFPYRIHQCLGQVRLKDDVCTVNVTGTAAGRPAHFDGSFVHPGDDFTGGVKVTLDGSVPLDETLLAALDPEAQRVVRALHPRGMITFAGAFGRDDPRQQQIDCDFDIGLRDCAMRCDKFSYPLERIRGVLHAKNGNWEFRDLEGRNDSAYIVCSGSWTAAVSDEAYPSAGPSQHGTGGQGGVLKLNFVGTDVPLEDELRLALGPGHQRIWSELRPRGTIDHLNIDLTYTSASDEMTLDVTAQKWKQKEQENVEGRGIAVEPVWLPYRVENLSGVLHYRDGLIELTNVAGTHGKTSVTLTGTSTLADNGIWRATLKSFAADRLECDRELIASLPGGLADAIRRLHLTGPINVQGSLEVAGSSERNQLPSAAWNLTFDIENGGLDAGLKLEHIHGGVQLVGAFDNRGLRCRGALAVDSLIYNNAQITQLTGPVWIDQSRVLLGSWTSQATQGEPSQLEGSVFGGTLEANAEVSQKSGDFSLQVSLADCELARLSQELTSRRDTLSGKAYAAVMLHGNARGTHTWRGNGSVRLRSADLYELPVMLAVLKVLRMQRPDKTAFNSSDIDFHIEGDHVYFDRINFVGDAVTLKGTGWMGLDRQVDIDFYTLVGRDRIRIPIITPALGLMSRELLLIHAGGTLDNPQLTKKTFPGLNDRLKQLFPELERQTSGQGLQLPGFPRR